MKMTWPATQVGLRPVKAGLGGHEASVIGVDDRVENASLPMRKQVRTTELVCAIFSGFIGVENQNDGENENGQKACYR